MPVSIPNTLKELFRAGKVGGVGGGAFILAEGSRMTGELRKALSQ